MPRWCGTVQFCGIRNVNELGHIIAKFPVLAQQKLARSYENLHRSVLSEEPAEVRLRCIDCGSKITVLMTARQYRMVKSMPLASLAHPTVVQHKVAGT